ncbi:hypothetical protein H0Z60_02735 [Ectothiorhodospiraceae bacterium WFHF3C12]|nr:hypothetical protein [Ectothiorhodospiraceae bacterium WFHF3C12]
MSSDSKPMTTGLILRRLLAAATLISAAALSGCGGGGTTLAGGGTSGTGITQGSVTGFGSVIVNGTRFETTGADVTVNGVPGTEGDLAVGMVVTLRGEWDRETGEGTAETVVYDDALRGPVSDVDPSAGRFRVLGQSVEVTGSTVFDLGVATDLPLSELAPDDRVAVSGHFDAAGVLRATRVERPAPADGVRLRGHVADGSLNSETNRFELDGGQVVDYTAVLATGPYEEEELEDRLEQAPVVVVEGAGVGMDGVLNAMSLSLPEGVLVGDDIDDVQLEGLTTSGSGWSDFSVAGQRVLTSGLTDFEPDNLPDSAFEVGLRVEVEGWLNDAGELVAEEVELRPEGDAEVEDFIAEIVDAQQRIMRTRLGVRVKVTETTVFEDDDDRDIAFDDLRGEADANGPDYLEVDGYWDAGNAYLVATRLEREDEDADESCSLEGRIQSIVGNTVGLLGVDVDVVEPSDLTAFADDQFVVAEPRDDEPADCEDGMRNAVLEAGDGDDDDDDDDD